MQCTRRSPAKINLTLAVLGRRDDGFHEIDSLVTPVGLFDDVTLTPRDDERIVVHCDTPGIPTDDRNLAWRAARALLDAAGKAHEAARQDAASGATIELVKRIPAGAGLGGGSSNAATTLVALNRVLGGPLGRDALLELAAGLGSDVPLFLADGACQIRGRGERVEPVAVRIAGWVVLVLPEIHVSTAEVYRAWAAQPNRERGPVKAAIPPSFAQQRPQHDAGPPTVSAALLMPELFNDLEAAAFAVAPGLADLCARLEQMTGGPVRMSGSGSTFFALRDDAGDAEELAGRIHRELELRVEVVSLGVSG